MSWYIFLCRRVNRWQYRWHAQNFVQPWILLQGCARLWLSLVMPVAAKTKTLDRHWCLLMICQSLLLGHLTLVHSFDPAPESATNPVSSWRLWEAVSIVQGTRLGYSVACLALTKYPGFGSWASAFILTQSQLWFPLAGLESLIAWASVPASIAWPEPWSLQNQDSNLSTSIFPHNIPEMQTKLRICCLPLVLSDPHCQSGSLMLFSPISPHHSTTPLHHCQKSYLLHFWDIYLLLPSRSKSPYHLWLLWGATWSAALSAFQTSSHWLWLGSNYKAYLTAGWQEDSVVWWMSMPWAWASRVDLGSNPCSFTCTSFLIPLELKRIVEGIT